MLIEGTIEQDLVSGQTLDRYERVNNVLTGGFGLFTAGWEGAFGEVGSLAEGAGSTCSFDQNTPVATDKGETPIGQLQVGDKVLAYDQQSSTTGYYTVTAVLVNQDPTIEHLRIDDDTLTTTPEHPFFTEEAGWVAAGELKAGEHVRRADGSWGEVHQVQVVEQARTMYNLTVKKAHTFFVGDKQWLVHNTCAGPTPSEEALGIQRQARAREIFDSNQELLRTSSSSYREVLVGADKQGNEVVMISGGQGSDDVRNRLRESGSGLNVLDDYSKQVSSAVREPWFGRERRGETFTFLKGGQYHTEANAAIAMRQGDIDNIWGLHSLDACGKCRGFLLRVSKNDGRIVVYGPSSYFVAENGDINFKKPR